MLDAMNATEYQAVMDDQGLTTSKAVKACLDRAAHYKRLYKVCEAGYHNAHMDGEFIQCQLHDLDEQRVNYVWLAVDTAKQERDQCWRYIEDGDKYISSLMIKYSGDLSQCTPLENAKREFAESIDEMNRRQEKGDWR